MNPRLSLRNLNTSRDENNGSHWPGKWLALALLALGCAHAGYALDQNKNTSQYIRDEWNAREGFPGGRVYAITQTPDGYLWIGTENGLVRFDGLQFRLLQHSELGQLPEGPVFSLDVDASGDLWVSQGGPRLFRYHNGAFTDVLAGLPAAGRNVTVFARGRDGELLFWANGTFKYSQGKLQTLVSMEEMPVLVISLAQTPDGKIWMGSKDSGLYFLENEHVYPAGSESPKVNSLLPVGSNELWLGTDDGLLRWAAGRFSRGLTSHQLDHLQVLAMLRDHDANTWVGTSAGLFRVNANGVDSFGKGQGQANEVTALFEDREGNLWVGTTRGIQRIRDAAFTTYRLQGSVAAQDIGPIYVDAQERTWFGGLQGGLFWMKDGEIRPVGVDGLSQDVVYSIAGNKQDVWVGRQQGGLTHLRYSGDSLTGETYTKAQGLAQNSVYAVHQSRDGTVWAGTLSAGISSFKNGGFTTYTTKDGLASNSVASILEAADGTMWFGTPNGVSAFSNGSWRTYNSGDGLPPGTVNSLWEDSSGIVWVGTANGLAFIRSGVVQAPEEVPNSLHEPVLGINGDRSNWLWMSTAKHILRVRRDKVLGLAVTPEDLREYGLADGLQGTEGVRRYRSMVMDTFGQVWISTSGGLSIVNAARPLESGVPAIVHVESISADGRAIVLKEPTRISAPHQRITVSYVGLSLSVPTRVLYRFKVDGFDRDWSEPVAARAAVYTNLSAGPYRFRVIASSSDGLWNGAESSVQFEVEPLLYQSWWFRLACLAAVIVIALALWRLRILQLTSRLNVRFEERLAERTRIAQELHDTLLQGLVSASMQLHVANEYLPTDSPAKPLVGRVLELMRRVVDEGRNAVRGLRSSQSDSLDLAEAFSKVREELSAGSDLEFRVIVEGAVRPLHPLIRDEIYRIGREALTNAFRHSHADTIEVELEFEPDRLRILVRDNGVGVDEDILRAGRDGHWGLSGMHERARSIGAGLRLLSRSRAGTEVELIVPAHVAFESQGRAGASGWFSRLLPSRSQLLERERAGRDQ